METKLEKEVRFLKAYAVSATLLCAVFVVTGFTLQNRKQKFEEIDVERINIVEKDGKLRMVISNQERQHPGIVNGKLIKRDGPRPPGMIFFNHLGDEMGGFVFGENGRTGHFGSLTLDKVHNDQTMAFRHMEGDNGKYSTSLDMWQVPNLPSDVLNAKYEAANKITDEAARKAAFQAMMDNNELTAPRLSLGKGRDDTAFLIMYDIKGKPRIRIAVKADGVAKLEFLDASGKVIQTLPDAASTTKK